jgi:hypothetical protein
MITGGRTMKKKILCAIAVLILSAAALMGCTEADKINSNLNQQADRFEVERRVTVYNARTDTVILQVEGYLSLSNNDSGELVITCKTGSGTYKKNYVYLTENTLYCMEDITGTHTDPYHYKWYWHTSILPDIEIVP